MHIPRHALALACGGLLLAACGNKGNLTLPPAAPVPVKPQPAAPAVKPASADDSSALRAASPSRSQ